MKGMRIEHCSKVMGSNSMFKTPNYKITTCSKTEWILVTTTDEQERNTYWLRSNNIKDPEKVLHGRKLLIIAELKKSKLYNDASMQEVELIAVVLYTGPMVSTRKKCNCIYYRALIFLLNSTTFTTVF
jgi:hypothetical protein